MNEPTKKQKEDAQKLVKELNDNPELMHMSLQMRKLQDDVLNGYFSNSYVIKMNYLEHVKVHTVGINSKEEFRIWLEKEKQRMKSIGRKFTHIERIEYRMLNQIYRDIILDEGAEFDASRDLVFQYDEKEIKIDLIVFGTEGSE